MKININGKEIDGESIGFAVISEPWAEYHLEDGSTARVKAVVTRIIRTEERNSDGTRVYSMQSQLVMVVDEGKESDAN
jgi:hypothetical protein